MTTPKVLIVEDSALVSHAVRDILTDNKYEADVAEDGRTAEKMIKDGDYGIVLLDMMLPDTSGEKLLKKWVDIPDMNIIIMTAYGEVSTAVDCLKTGAYDFLVKPVEKELLLKTVRNASREISLVEKVTQLTEIQRRRDASVAVAADIVFASEPMHKTMEMAQLVAKSDFSSMLITGESGTGKGMLSRAIHTMGKRKKKPFVEVNCSALPANLIESELFGHVKGAFTDAKEDKVGLFELANGGTLFLDEIGDMDVKLQSKLLKAIEERQFRRIGGTKSIKVDVAIIAATNANLMQQIEDGDFRLDLYYRLNVIPLELSALRDRHDDIPALSDYFLGIFSKKFGKKVEGFTDEAYKLMMEYDWPGNVRELSNVVERGCILTQSNAIGAELLMFPKSAGSLTSTGGEVKATKEMFPVMTLAEVEKLAIEAALHKAGGNKNEAARILGVHRTTLYKKIEEYGLEAG